jgi:hypothetical protein
MLRSTAVAALPLGALGSVAALLYAIHRNPSRLLIVLFVLWVVAPFAALAVATAQSTDWSATPRRALHIITLLLAVGSLVTYGFRVFGPAGPQGAFLFVIVPPVSCVLAVTAVATAAWLGRRR